jgi:glycosyltransferase involved in cell wall biosynthesis
MKASITIATHNRADALDKTLASIFRQHVSFPFEVIVVDDGSNDHTSDVLVKYPVIMSRIERAPVHRNPAPARNLAITMAQSDILIMQSDDVMHQSPDTIETLVREVETHPQSAVLATVLNVDANNTVLGTYVSRRVRRAFFFLGAIRREHIYAIGGNDEEFTQPGYEDAWLRDCLIYGAHIPFLYSDRVVGHHQDHSRPIERYGKDFGKRGGTIDMRNLYYQKVVDAQAERILWKAKISRLYDHAEKHTQ